jgi:hypothetical protein
MAFTCTIEAMTKPATDHAAAVLRLAAVIAIAATTLTALAEPSASLAHLPFLWLLAAAVSSLLAWLVVHAIKRSGRLETGMRFWGLTVILFALLLVFLSPIIVALGSILITGRTM